MATKKQTLKFPQINQYVFIDEDGDERFDADSLEEAKMEWIEGGCSDGFLYRKIPAYKFEAEAKVTPVKA